MIGTSPTAVGTVRHWVGAARLEACPVAVGWRVFAVAPCVGGEMGATGAAGSAQGALGNQALWAALDGRVRATGRPVDAVGLNVDLGIQVPLTRYQLVDDGRELYGTPVAGFLGVVGLFFRLP